MELSLEYILPWTISLIFLLALYKYLTINFDYWEKRGVPHPKPLPWVGNLLDAILGRMTIGHCLGKIYNQFDSPYIGIWGFTNPVLIIKSPELMKSILVKDFQYFNDRTVSVGEDTDSMLANFLFFAKNQKWRTARLHISPFFSTGKLKQMSDAMNTIGEEMVQYLEKMSSKSQAIDVKEVMDKFATNILTATSFGLNSHSFQYDDAQFNILARLMLEFDKKRNFRSMLYLFAPATVAFFRVKFFDIVSYNFIRTTFHKLMADREQSNTKKNDLLQIMVELKRDNSKVQNDGDAIVAHAGQIFSAGIETTSSTISFTLYELALNTNIQDNLRDEIKAAIEAHGGLNYEAVKSMKYLHKVVSETVRKYPVLPFLDRRCTADYKVPESDLTIEKGTAVYISMLGVHFDPQYYPEPEKYDPERFSEENIATRPRFSYMAFGEGPHNCIGARYGMLVSKIGVIQMLLNFEIAKSAETPCPLIFDPNSFLLKSLVGIPVKLNRIHTNITKF